MRHKSGDSRTLNPILHFVQVVRPVCLEVSFLHCSLFGCTLPVSRLSPRSTFRYLVVSLNRCNVFDPSVTIPTSPQLLVVCAGQFKVFVLYVLFSLDE